MNEQHGVKSGSDGAVALGLWAHATRPTDACAARWSATWQQLAVDGGEAAAAPAGALEALVERYGEAHRAYHTLTHVEACFRALDAVVPSVFTADDQGALEIALWFHDAIYDPKRGDNEAASADLCAEVLTVARVVPSIIERARALIMATVHGAPPTTTDAKLLVDVDLGILGASAARFDAYEHEVRFEYQWVPLDVFCAKRAEILRGFLERDAIYQTAHFQAALEARARANLARSIAALESGALVASPTGAT